MPKITIAIPVYEMHGEGTRLLHILLNSIFQQTYTNFEVIVSDHSKDDVIENFCKNYGNIFYYRNKNKRGNSSANVNNAIKYARGEYIKTMFQDDFFKSNNSLKVMMEKIGESNWVVCGSDQYEFDILKPYRGRFPVINADINAMALGDNYYGGPSCVLYKKHPAISFDENLIWLMDTDLYRQLHLVYGNPSLINLLLITTKYSETNVSNTLATQELRQNEYNYVHKKIFGV